MTDGTTFNALQRQYMAATKQGAGQRPYAEIVDNSEIRDRVEVKGELKIVCPKVLKIIDFANYDYKGTKAFSTDFSSQVPIMLTFFDYEPPKIDLIKEGNVYWFDKVEFRMCEDKMFGYVLQGTVRKRMTDITLASEQDIAVLNSKNKSNSTSFSTAVTQPEPPVADTREPSSSPVVKSSPQQAAAPLQVSAPTRARNGTTSSPAPLQQQQAVVSREQVPVQVNSQRNAAAEKTTQPLIHVQKIPARQLVDNPNVELDREIRLASVTILDMHLVFEQSKPSTGHFQVQGEVRGYWPKEFSEWADKDKGLFFVLFLNDGSTGKDLPVTFQGEHAAKFLAIADEVQGETRIEHIKSQMKYVTDHTIKIYVEADLAVQAGVRLLRYFGFGASIRPLLKRKFLEGPTDRESK